MPHFHRRVPNVEALSDKVLSGILPAGQAIPIPHPQASTSEVLWVCGYLCRLEASSTLASSTLNSAGCFDDGSRARDRAEVEDVPIPEGDQLPARDQTAATAQAIDRKSTRLNSSHT